MGVFPSDHVVGKLAAYRAVIQSCHERRSRQKIDGGGIQPRWPETGYGYVEFPPGTVAGSKPDRLPSNVSRKACLGEGTEYVAAGNFFWNSGMFFGARTFCWTNCASTCPRPLRSWRRCRVSSGWFRREAQAAFPLCDNISIDFAVLEKAKNVCGIRRRLWLERCRSWNAVYNCCRRTSRQCGGPDAICLQSHNNFVDARQSGGAAWRE